MQATTQEVIADSTSLSQTLRLLLSWVRIPNRLTFKAMKNTSNAVTILVVGTATLCVALLVFICGGAAYVFRSFREGSRERSQANSLSDSIDKEKRILVGTFKSQCRSILKSPSTADFKLSSYTKFAGDKDGHKLGYVYGTIDSQNSFGAMLRADVEGVYLRTGDKWTLATIAIDGKTQTVSESAKDKIDELEAIGR